MVVPGERLDHLKASRDEALLEVTAVHRGKGMKMKIERQPAEK